MWLEGCFVDAIAPGRYDVSAGTRDKRFGETRDVIVEDGGDHEVTVRVSPGAELRLRCDPPRIGGTFEIVHEGRVVRVGTVRPYAESSYIVPAGTLSVRFTAQGSAAAREQTIELEPGVSRTVVFGD